MRNVQVTVIGMKSKISWYKVGIWFVIVLTIALFYIFNVGYSFFHADEPGYLLWGKYCWDNLKLIFSFKSLSPIFFYYRPLQRIAWALDYHFFILIQSQFKYLKEFYFSLLLFSYIKFQLYLVGVWGE